MDAQIGLHLCCSQTPEDRFSRVVAIYEQPSFIQASANSQSHKRERSGSVVECLTRD